MNSQIKTVDINQTPLLNKRTQVKFRTSDFLIVVFWTAYLFVRLWVADSENLNDSYKAAMIVPYIDKNIGTIMLLLTFIVFGGLFLLNRLKFDGIFPAFLLRIGLYFIPMLYLEGDFQFGVAFAIIQTMLAYYIGYNYKGKLKIIVNILIVATLVLLGQIFYVVIYNKISIFNFTDLKWYMRLPGGQTNSLGAFLVISYVIVDLFYADNKKLIKYLYLALMFLGVWSVGTRSGLLVLVGYYCLKCVRFFLSNLKTENSLWKRKRKNLEVKIIFTLLAIGIIVCFLFLFKEEIFQRLEWFTVKGMTSSRFKVYAEVFEYILKNPILGRSAFAYTAYDAVRTHNFLLESLIQTGVVGTLIYISIWCYCLKKVLGIKENKIKLLFCFFILITLIHGSVEPNLFSVTSDTFVWFLLGVSVSISKRQVKDK